MNKFEAKIVESFKDEFSDEFVVFNILFEESDPDEGGGYWYFQRALGSDGSLEGLGEEDDGVCTVKAIQQVTIYEGIDSFVLRRTSLVCIFQEEKHNETGTEGLEISYSINDEQWEKLKYFSSLVFQGRPYFRIA